MSFTREQKQRAYKNLSPRAQDFIMAPESTDLISHYLDEAGLTDEQSNLADSEILYTMFGLQTLDETMDAIAKLVSKNTDDLSTLKRKLYDDIITKIPKENTKNYSENTPADEIRKEKMNISDILNSLQNKNGN